jgi:tRNA(fMet)-specific endonuclease VapC
LSYLLDTDWLVDYLSGRQPAIALLNALVPSHLSISIITYAEAYDGIYYGQDPEASEEGFLRFLEAVTVLPITGDIARVWASLRGSLRKSGMLIPPSDLFIAATAISFDLTLVSRNRRHFERVPGLRLYNETTGQTAASPER